jgi:hypothetical protein
MLTQKDHLRYPADTNGRLARASRSSRRASKGVFSGPATDSNTAMRLLSHPSDTDDGMERCRPNGCVSSGQRGSEPCLHSGIFESSSRRGHRRTQNQFDCMWAERHRSRSINDSGLAREYQYQNLMRHIRKKNFHREPRSC